MAFFKKIFENTNYFGKQIFSSTPMTNQEVGLEQINYSGVPDPQDREAIYPQWFFSSRIGQPRQIDSNKIREFSKSAWVQMVLNTFKKQIFTTEWDVIKSDEEDETAIKELDSLLK